MQDILVEESRSIKNIPGFAPSLVIQPLYEAALRTNKQNGGSASRIEADGPLSGTLIALPIKIVMVDSQGDKGQEQYLQGSVSNDFSCFV